LSLSLCLRVWFRGIGTAITRAAAWNQYQAGCDEDHHPSSVNAGRVSHIGLLPSCNRLSLSWSSGAGHKTQPKAMAESLPAMLASFVRPQQFVASTIRE
jgi:hypothetical protein